MKCVCALSLTFAITLSAQAAMVRFQLSPPGTDVAVGLSPSNQVPPAVTSTGSGGELSAGIVLDTDASILHVAVGYGSAAGFADLTGPAVAMHIHGPATTNQNAGVLVSLVPYDFPATNPAQGGVIVGSVPWPTNDTPALLAGQTFLNIHTAAYPNGEIRAQLIPVNEAPVLVCPASGTLECGQPQALIALFSDAEGDPLTVVWSVNGAAVATNTLPARAPGLPAMDQLNEQLPLGTNLVEVTVVDSGGNTVSCASQIAVVDTTPPVIVSASANPATLWPPNHKFVPVVIRAEVTDACSSTTWKIVRVTSNEQAKKQGNGKGRGSDKGGGSGNTPPDWTITGDHTLKLRAERSGTSNGRVYSIVIQAEDAAGNLSATKVVNVTVPHSQGKG